MFRVLRTFWIIVVGVMRPGSVGAKLCEMPASPINMQRLTMRDAAFLLAAAGVSFLIILPFTWQHFYYQVVVGLPLERELGFSVASPFTDDPDYFLGREVSSIGSVDVRGKAYAAGLREGDVLVDYCRRNRGATAFFRELSASRGGELCVSVVRIDDPGRLEARRRKRVCLRARR